MAAHSPINKDSMAGATPVPKLPEIPRQRYLDEAFYQAELEHVFRKTWLHVGHVSEFPEVGSFRLIELPFAPVIVVRGKDKQLRAFINACRHRGATVLNKTAGCAKSLTCQYHGWTYDLSGKLISISDSESFPDLDKDDYPLDSLRCELWGGFIYINFDAKAKSLLDFLAPIDKRYGAIAAHNPDQSLRVVAKNSWEVACNWKAMYENFCESYHVDYIHGKTAAQLIDSRDATYEVYVNGHGSNFNYYRPNNNADWKGVASNTPLPSIPGTDQEIFNNRASTFFMFPNSSCISATSSLFLMQIWPLSIDRCQLTYTIYGLDWGDGPMPPEWNNVITGLNDLAEEDLSTMAEIQKGMQASAGRGTPLGSQEVLPYNLNVEIDRRIGMHNIPEALRVPSVLKDFTAD